MKIITLTSDLGLNDHYVASLKGAILSTDNQVNIVDVSHNVKPFDTAHAAFLLRSCAHNFPEGTVHVVAIDTEPVINYNELDGSFPSIMVKNGQYFIANDNGFFGAYLGVEKPDSFWRVEDVLSNPNHMKFPSKNMLIPIAMQLLAGEPIESLASPQEKWRKSLLTEPAIQENLIKGAVVYLDSYGNIITNITRSLFNQVGQNNPFIIMMRKKEYYIDHISNTYNEVIPGERLALFNENDLLEIAINRGANSSTGGAEKLMGIRKGDIIRIEFTPQGSRETLSELF